MLIEIDGRQWQLEDLVKPWRKEIWVGRSDTEVYNVIPLCDGDVFQCTIVQEEQGWMIRNGQRRTECPKGIRSDRERACSLCRGCCVNSRPANPTYSWRMPSRPTLLNKCPVPPEGSVLQEGDIITIANKNESLCYKSGEIYI